MASTASYEQVLNRYPIVQEWLTLLDNLGRAPATLEAYGRGLAHYLLHCEASSLEAESITFEQVTLYIRRLLPGQENAVANSTLHQRLTAIRLWYDHLVFQGRCAQNPVPRGQHGRLCQIPGHSGFMRGLVPRLIKLPDIPSDEQWRYFLSIAARSSIRDRLMLSLAYCGALRRAELVGLRIEDLDLAHRLISVRAETTKGRRSRIARHSSDPYTFYDLGDSYCSNPFWSSCPHRMACAGCDFNVPKASARAQALESKASIGHYLEAVPLTADERAIVERDLAKLDGLIRKLDDVPTLYGRTPSQIEAKKNR
ncbi:hypothetical protein N032_08275 [Pseudomonas syringae pv. pisi str. PP1]|uniref:site-specific integrase n=1 Tax=Pseudomonas syringae TaxID=317 RepID=UPI000F5B99BE|nr:tyrosine-type recombinase/integrase [Pseudomonas syringae]AZG85674.1 hypothetical protein N032_08275 [Pseudomonas syringae pv. pisi str. PP1]